MNNEMIASNQELDNGNCIEVSKKEKLNISKILKTIDEIATTASKVIKCIAEAKESIDKIKEEKNIKSEN